MKNWTKIIVIFLGLVMFACILSGCSDKDSANTEKNGDNNKQISEPNSVSIENVTNNIDLKNDSSIDDEDGLFGGNGVKTYAEDEIKNDSSVDDEDGLSGENGIKTYAEDEIENIYKQANRFYANGQREKAIDEFSKIKDYKDSSELAEKIKKEVSYDTAIQKYDEGLYADSYELLKNLKGYKDADSYIAQIKELYDAEWYSDAMELFGNGSYDEAKDIFEKIIPYRDSEYMANACERESDYLSAIGMIKLGNLESASSLLSDIQDYKDSRLYVFCYENGYNVYFENNIPVIQFGSYPCLYEDLKEPLEWYVIDYQTDSINPEASKVTLLCKNIIDYYQFAKDGTYFENWETSDIRQEWCVDFVFEAFSKKEKRALTIKAISNPTWDNEHITYDEIFLLSESEVKQIPEDIWNAQPTMHAIRRGVYTSNDSYGWFLRSPGATMRGVVKGKMISYANLAGNMTDLRGYYYATVGIRPAIYITLLDLENHNGKKDYNEEKIDDKIEDNAEKVNLDDLQEFVIKLEKNVEKECDLDGDGVNEIISFSSSSSEYLDWVKVFIDGKQLYYFFNEYNADYFDVSVSVYDINPSDNQKELMIDLLSEFTHSYYSYRYNNNKLKMLFEVDGELIDFIILSKQENENNVLVSAPTDCALGNHVPIIKTYKIENEKLVEIVPESNIYNVTVDKWGKKWYTAAKDIKVYENVSDQENIMTIRPGEQFAVEKIKYIDAEATYGLINLIDKGEVGWINIKMYDGCTWDDPLVVDPGFAG